MSAMPAMNYSAHQYNPIAHGPGAAIASAKAASPAKDSGFSFGDLLDIINPLQHIPVISTIYRHLTGDKIGTAEKLAGDTLYGGLTGLACSLGDTVFEKATGKTVGDTVYAMLFGDDKAPDATPTIAPNSAPDAAPNAAPAVGYAEAEPAKPAAEVKPAIYEPSLLGLAGEFCDTVDGITDVMGQRAAQAYRAAGRLVNVY